MNQCVKSIDGFCFVIRGCGRGKTQLLDRQMPNQGMTQINSKNESKLIPPPQEFGNCLALPLSCQEVFRASGSTATTHINAVNVGGHRGDTGRGMLLSWPDMASWNHSGWKRPPGWSPTHSPALPSLARFFNF